MNGALGFAARLGAALVIAVTLLAGLASASPGKGGKDDSPGHEMQGLVALLLAIGDAAPGTEVAAADTFMVAALGAEIDHAAHAARVGLDDARPALRYYGIAGLGASAMASRENGEDMDHYLPLLVDALADPEPSVREVAAATIAACLPRVPAWVGPHLTALLDDPEPRVVSAALSTLRFVAPDGTQTGHAMAEMDDEDANRRSRAVKVLGAAVAGTGDRDALWAVIDSLRDPAASVRWQAATALGALDQAGLEALGPLHRVASDRREDIPVRRAARIALDTILY